MQVNLKALGCRLNEAELESWAQDFQTAGHEIVKNTKDAELVVLNSCAVTHQAVRKSRRLIRRIHRDNPTAKLVVSGCYASLKPDEVAQTLGVDLVVNNTDKNKLVELTTKKLSLETMPKLATEPAAVSLFSRGRQRAFVKVQDGCRYRCTFCIVTIARGAEKSRPIQEIINAINTLHQQGIQEVVLTGVHLGGYGSDLNLSLEELVRAVLFDTAIPRLRLGSLEPWDIPHSFFRLFQNPRLLPHLHLPLQSGSDSVLRRMGRRCGTSDFEKIVELARVEIEDLNITTDVMLGFPGETDHEWKESLAYCDKIHFGHIHIFTYSRRHGTMADNMPMQVSDAVKKDRSKTLHRLAKSMKIATFKQFVGQMFPVLWEGCKEISVDGMGTVFGYTPNYLRVAMTVPSFQSVENRITTVKTQSVSDSQEFLWV